MIVPDGASSSIPLWLYLCLLAGDMHIHALAVCLKAGDDSFIRLLQAVGPHEIPQGMIRARDRDERIVEGSVNIDMPMVFSASL